MQQRDLRRMRVLSDEDIAILETTTEKIHAHLLSPIDIDLTDREEKYLEKLIAAWAIMQDTPVKATWINKVVEVCNVGPRQARNIIDDAKEVFGPIYEWKETINEEFLVQRYIRLAEKAEEREDFLTVKQCYDSISKIKGYFNQKKEWERGDIKLPPVQFSSDTNLLQAPSEEVEDAEIVE